MDSLNCHDGWPNVDLFNSIINWLHWWGVIAVIAVPVGAIATMGVIVGTDIPMMLGAMIMGPLGGFTIKKFDQYFQHQ